MFVSVAMRRALVGLLCIAVVGLVGACGGGGDGKADGGGGGKADGDKPAPTSGTIQYLNDISQWKKGMDEVSVTLKRLTGIGMKAASVPDVTQYQQIVKQSLRTGKGQADLMKWWSGYRLQELASSDSLADLTEVWSEVQAKGWVAPGIKPAFSYQGKVYGMPMAQSYWVVYYNKKLFADAGIQPPKTWDEFVSNAAKLKAKGVTPFYTTVGDRWPSFIWFEELLAKRDPAAYNAVVSNKASYTDPVVHEAMDVWKGFIDKGYFTKPDVKLQDAPPRFKAGRFAMLIAGTWFNQQIAASGMKPGKDYGAFIMPSMSGAGASAFFETVVLAVPSNAPNKDAAIALLKRWLDPQVQKQWSTFLKDVPVNPTLSSDDPVIQDVQQQVKTTKPQLLNRYFEATPPAIVEGNVDNLASFMLNPGKLDSTLDKMQDLAKQEWANWQAGNGAG
jgi:multiple sugar transport system substrate-binding protein